jgi:hypothetical protein|tara:strand:- start:1863 stop:2000 length:138 start_codon:yes stop_codon:yes gene_type:complete
MLLDLLALCTIPAGIYALSRLPWTDAQIEATDCEARALFRRFFTR